MRNNGLYLLHYFAFVLGKNLTRNTQRPSYSTAGEKIIPVSGDFSYGHGRQSIDTR